MFSQKDNMANEELLQKALQIISEAEKRGIEVRLLGGLAFAYLSGASDELKVFKRHYNDIDLASTRRQASQLNALLTELGLVPNKVFNALHGYDRLQFFYGQTKVDVFLDEFKMSHYLDLKARLGLSHVTIPVSDLLLTKLQIHELTEKDMLDVASLLAKFKFGNADSSTTIDAGYIANLLSKDWGFYKTATDNIRKIEAHVQGLNISQEIKSKIIGELEYLLGAIMEKPKSASWKIRAKIGERVRWYALPEEVGIAAPQPEELSYRWVSFSEMDKMAKAIADKVLSKYGRPGAIVYIERGGMVFGTLLAKYLHVSNIAGLQAISYKRLGERGKTVLLQRRVDIVPKGYVLLADDIADTGETLRKVSSLLSKKYKLITATIAYKPRSVVAPDIYGMKVDNNTWIIFDYEEKEVMDSLNGKVTPMAFGAEEKAYAQTKEKCKQVASALEAKSFKPDAIIYSLGSAIEARLLSDYLDVKRVEGISSNKELKPQLAKLPKSSRLLIVAGAYEAEKIEKGIRRIRPGMKIEIANFD
jgi:hypoxanthine phosphoribosyltransferase